MTSSHSLPGPRHRCLQDVLIADGAPSPFNGKDPKKIVGLLVKIYESLTFQIRLVAGTRSIDQYIYLHKRMYLAA